MKKGIKRKKEGDRFLLLLFKLKFKKKKKSERWIIK